MRAFFTPVRSGVDGVILGWMQGLGLSIVALVKKARKNLSFGCSRRSGQAMVEFAFVVPLLVLLLFAIIQWGFIIAAYVTLRHAAATGVRYALQVRPTPTVTQVKDLTSNAITPMLDKLKIETGYPLVNLVDTSLDGTPSAMSVEIVYNLPLIIKYVVPGGSSGTKQLSAKAITRGQVVSP